MKYLFMAVLCIIWGSVALHFLAPVVGEGWGMVASITGGAIIGTIFGSLERS